jgi:hypothetical protein
MPPSGTDVSPSVSRSDLIGTWRPVVLFGGDFHSVGRINGSRVTVRFQSDPRLGWTGYDGCNWTNGPFQVGKSGTFSATARTTTLRGCYPRRLWTTNVTVMTRADRVALKAGRLSVYGPSGRQIGVYVRTA